MERVTVCETLGLYTILDAGDSKNFRNTGNVRTSILDAADNDKFPKRWISLPPWQFAWKDFIAFTRSEKFTSYTTGNSRPLSKELWLWVWQFRTRSSLSAGSPAATDRPWIHQDAAHCNLAHRIANLIGLFGVHSNGVISTYLLALWVAIFNLLYCYLMQEAYNVQNWITLRPCGFSRY